MDLRVPLEPASYIDKWPSLRGSQSNLAVAALIIAALYVGREIFVPLALCLLALRLTRAIHAEPEAFGRLSMTSPV
jgi:hypothetical protein